MSARTLNVLKPDCVMRLPASTWSARSRAPLPGEEQRGEGEHRRQRDDQEHVGDGRRLAGGPLEDDLEREDHEGEEERPHGDGRRGAVGGLGDEAADARREEDERERHRRQHREQQHVRLATVRVRLLSRARRSRTGAAADAEAVATASRQNENSSQRDAAGSDAAPGCDSVRPRTTA